MDIPYCNLKCLQAGVTEIPLLNLVDTILRHVQSWYMRLRICALLVP